VGEIERIADQARRAFEKDAWHGPALSELLADVDHERARKRPIAGGHNIWELVLHITTWEKVAARRLAGEAVQVSDEEDYPRVPLDGGEAAWKQALGELEAADRRLREAILAASEARLEQIVPGKDHTVYVMLHGVVQHNLYHAGQIAILKKA
jgi:uncharacterized damage-inducible protein DinB